MSRAGTAEHGFTLLELVVVMLLLALITAVAAPRFAALGDPGMRDVGRLVVAELRARRSEAMRTGRPVLASPSAIGLPAGYVLMAERADRGPDGGPGVLFLPDGRSTGGSLLLAGDADQMRIVVDWLTGEVRLVP